MNYIKSFSVLISLALIILFCYISFQAFDTAKLKQSFFSLIGEPMWLCFITGFYLLSFIFRAVAWRIYTRGKITLSSAVAALFYSLFFNHLLPVKAGDIVRIGIIRLKNRHISMSEIVHSVAVMRGLDTLSLIAMAGVGMYIFKGYLTFTSFPFFLAGGIAVLFISSAAILYPKVKSLLHEQVVFLKKGMRTKRFPLILLLILCSWISEGIVVFSFAHNLGYSLSFLESVWVNSITVGGQIFQITPGGIATYETIMSASLVMLKIPLGDSYTIALISHAYKFIFSYVAGVIALFTVPVTLSQLKVLIRKKGEQQI